MRHRNLFILALAAAVVSVIAVGVALAAGPNGATQTSKARHGAKQARASKLAQRSRVVSAHAPRATAQRLQDTPTPSDSDNIQSGDQTAPDQPSSSSESESSPESESSTDSSEQGQPGEPAVGHEDAPGQNVDHQCDGNCQE